MSIFTDYGDGTGIFQWSPTVEDTGSYLLTIWAYDLYGGVDSTQLTIIVTSPTSVAKENESYLPLTFTLNQNNPNPFNSMTTIHYQLPKPAEVCIKIYNLQGQEIRTLIKEKKEGGYFTIIWDGKDNQGNIVVSGVYFYRMNAKSRKQQFIQTKKMILLR